MNGHPAASPSMSGPTRTLGNVPAYKNEYVDKTVDSKAVNAFMQNI